MLKIFVGVPENDQHVEVPRDWTVTQILNEFGVQQQGQVTLNGRPLRPADLSKSISDLGAVENDSLHVIKKLDSA